MPTLDTVQVDLQPQDLLRILRGFDKRNDAWSFVGTTQNSGPLQLDLWVDGCDTVHVVTLHPNGSWSATTHVVLGERPANFS